MTERDELAFTLSELIDDESPLHLLRWQTIADALLAAGYRKQSGGADD